VFVTIVKTNSVSSAARRGVSAHCIPVSSNQLAFSRVRL
jgi:hypothetical protein